MKIIHTAIAASLFFMIMLIGQKIYDFETIVLAVLSMIVVYQISIISRKIDHEKEVEKEMIEKYGDGWKNKI